MASGADLFVGAADRFSRELEGKEARLEVAE